MKTIDAICSELRTLVPEGIPETIKRFKEYLPENSPFYNLVLSLEARFNEINKQRFRDVISDEELRREYNRIRTDLLDLIDQMASEDITASSGKPAKAKDKTGRILHRIPKHMELGVETRCIIRLARDEEKIIKNIEFDAHVKVEQVRISNLMAVSLLDPSNRAFIVRTVSEPEQIIFEEDYTQWIFYVRPLQAGVHSLILKVSVIEMVHGKERKHELVFEHKVEIVTAQPKVQEEPAFSSSNYTFACYSTSSTTDITAVPAVPGTLPAPAVPSLVMKKWSGLSTAMKMSAAAFALTATGVLTILNFTPQGRNWVNDMFVPSPVEEVVYHPPLPQPNPDYPLPRPITPDPLPQPIDPISTPDTVEDITRPKGGGAFRLPSSQSEEDKAITLPDLEKGAWEEASRKNTIPAYYTFLTRHPAGKYRKEAHFRIERLEREGWKLAFDRDVPASYAFYVNDVQGEKYRAQAKFFQVRLEDTGIPKAPFPPRVVQDMVIVKGGTFMMGCSGGQDGCNKIETPAHQVEEGDFYIDRYEVSNEQYASFLNAYGRNKVKAGIYKGKIMVTAHPWGVVKKGKTWKPQPGYEKYPVVNVTWFGANEYARFYGLRLPTEAEWEYAARGGQLSKNFQFSGSNNPDEVAWTAENAGGKTHPRGRKNANELGLYDMTGNVKEWCLDDIRDFSKTKEPLLNPRGERGTENAVVRGGAWNCEAQYCRNSYRTWLNAAFRYDSYGFRCVRIE